MADRVWNPILVPSDEDWKPRGGSRSGGKSFLGSSQVVASPTAQWVASLTIPCNTPAKVLAMRTVLALGRGQVWIVGPVEVTRAPWAIDPLTGGSITYAGQDPGAAAPYDKAADFALRDPYGINQTRIIITRRAGGHVLPGQYLSIGHRMHAVVDLLSPDPTDAGSGLAVPGDIAIEIRPWTGAAYVAGTPIEFGRPVCRMRLATDNTGALRLQLSRFGTVTLDLEAV